MKKAWERLDQAYWVCYRFVRDRIWYPFYYRFFGLKLHLIRTGLPPYPWYEVDTRMLYGMMNMAKWFVENDMRHNDYEEWERDLKENREGLDEETLNLHIEMNRQQRDADFEILSIVNWWEDYENRRQEISDALTEWANYNRSFLNDGKFHITFLDATNQMNDEEREHAKDLHDKLRNLEEELQKEEEEYLIRLIKVRECMWS